MSRLSLKIVVLSKCVFACEHTVNVDCSFHLLTVCLICHTGKLGDIKQK